MIVTDVLILECEWAGRTTAYYLATNGIKDIVCIDADTNLGGLMKSVNIEGFCF